MRLVLAVAPVIWLAGCPDAPSGEQGACTPEDQIDAWGDGDGDGWGSGEPTRVCTLGADQVDRGLDCDDEDAEIHPEATEACNEVDDDCDGQIDQDISRLWYTDADGDGFGIRYPALSACAPPGEGWAPNDSDCDDGSSAVHPGAVEICNDRIDDDCNGLADDADGGIDDSTRLSAWEDADSDGFGNPATEVRSCTFSAWLVDNGDDCDDTLSFVNPAAQEVCNGGIDDDCDDDADSADASIDPSTQSDFFADTDGDGFGDPNAPILGCRPYPGYASANDNDCDDTRFGVAPNRPETLCDALDNDCDPITTDDKDTDEDGFSHCTTDCDDLDAAVNPDALELPDDGRDENCNGLEGCFVDDDEDDARTDVWVEVPDPDCNDAGNATADAPLDCDDTDPSVNVDVDWVEDEDGDGYGTGPVVTRSCLDPGGILVPSTDPLDCDDADDTINPGEPDPCNDGLDVDCDQRDDCASCKDWQGSAEVVTDGIYTIETEPGVSEDVYCDMTTDGGGWTLVASTTGGTLDDRSAGWYADLTTLTPAGPNSGVWDGLRPRIDGPHDVRFTCKLNVGAAAMDVDLSFYQVPWYDIITTGNEAQSCFNDSDGFGQTPAVPPHRRDNVSGDERLAGDQWDAGCLEGEDFCDDNGDFTVDFDDRGMDNNEADGTDWGEDDSSMKCGVQANANSAWFVFVRE